MNAPAFTPTYASATGPNTARRAATICALAAALSLSPSALAAPSRGVLSSNTELRRVVATDATAILQHALPLPAELRGEPTPPVRLLQTELERLALCTRSRGGAARQLNARAALLRARAIIEDRRLDLVLDVPAVRRTEAAEAVARIDRAVSDLAAALNVSDQRPTIFPVRVAALAGAAADAVAPHDDGFDGVAAETARRAAVAAVGDLEGMMVDGAPFPYRIPRRYEQLPRLLGRATLRMTVSRGTGNTDWRDTPRPRDAMLTIVLDGYSAPLTAGNFIELAQNGAYDGAPVLDAAAGFCVRVGARGEPGRKVPLEIMLEGERTPVYGATLDEAGVADLQPALPVTAFGAVAMEHSVEDVNDSSARWLVFDIDPRSYTARAINGSVLTGSWATFGYVVEGGEILNQIRAGDSILKCVVVDGLQHFQPHA